MRDVYIIIPTSEIGGAEKRISGIWFEFHKRGDLKPKLILSKEMYGKLKLIPEFKGIEKFESFMKFDLAGLNYRRTAKNIYEFSKSLNASALFHYVLAPPLYFNTQIKYLLTFPSTSFKKYNWKGLLTLLHGFQKADAIDVLDPRIYGKLKKLLGSKVNLTPGSYVQFNHYPSLAFKKRDNSLVFLGLLCKEKQADRFLKSLPRLNTLLKSKGIHKPHFRILGREAADFDLKSFLAQTPSMAEVDYKIEYVTDPATVLKKSKVFFSLQRTDNYPSKALLESIACGNLPVVTHVGNSKLIADRTFADFVPRNFTAEDLAGAALQILTLSQSEYEQRSEIAKEFVRANFSIERSLNYFKSLYQETS